MTGIAAGSERVHRWDVSVSVIVLVLTVLAEISLAAAWALTRALELKHSIPAKATGVAVHVPSPSRSAR